MTALKSSYYKLCAVSGCVWAVVAYALGHQSMSRFIWGGIIVSPLVGLAVGAIYRPAYRFPAIGRAAMSLLTLYVAAALFGLASGVYDAARGLPGGGSRNSVAVVLQCVLGTLWGVTFTGYVGFLWPLAHLNHLLLRRFAADPATPCGT